MATIVKCHRTLIGAANVRSLEMAGRTKPKRRRVTPRVMRSYLSWSLDLAAFSWPSTAALWAMQALSATRS
jgi:hypothetical protein